MPSGSRPVTCMRRVRARCRPCPKSKMLRIEWTPSGWLEPARQTAAQASRLGDRKIHSLDRCNTGNEQRTRKANCTKGHPNRARSKNNPDGKRNDPKTDWPKYSKDRASEGKNYLGGLAAISDKVRNILGMAPGIRDKRVSAILASIVKSEGLSYWGLVKHFQKHPEDLKRCEL